MAANKFPLFKQAPESHAKAQRTPISLKNLCALAPLREEKGN
jgi:hypothetical protein